MNAYSQNGSGEFEGMYPQAPEDGGFAGYNPAQAVEKFLTSPAEFEALLVNSRFDEEQAMAHIMEYRNGLQARSVSIMVTSFWSVAASIGRDGQARTEAVFVAAGAASPALMDGARRRRGVMGAMKGFFRKKPKAVEEMV